MRKVLWFRPEYGVIVAIGLGLAGCGPVKTSGNAPNPPPARPPASSATSLAADAAPAPQTPERASTPRKPAAARGNVTTSPSTALVESAEFLARNPPEAIRLMCFNVNWDHAFPDVDATTAARFARMVRAIQPDILALQEVKKTAEETAALLNAVLPLPDGASWHASKGGNNAIVARFPLRKIAEHTTPRGQREIAFALVDLPDDRYASDIYISNNHFKCCDGEKNDPLRQQQSDAIVNWIRDIRTPGGHIDLMTGTPIVICGDLNIVGSMQPVETLLSGDIQDEKRYGPDAPPDWDDSHLTDARPLHNGVGPDDYTWRDDGSGYPAGRLDFVIYTDSVMEATNRFILNTTTLTESALREASLERNDVTLDQNGRRFDHLPLVVDFRLNARD